MHGMDLASGLSLESLTPPGHEMEPQAGLWSRIRFSELLRQTKRPARLHISRCFLRVSIDFHVLKTIFPNWIYPWDMLTKLTSSLNSLCKILCETGPSLPQSPFDPWWLTLQLCYPRNLGISPHSGHVGECRVLNGFWEISTKLRLCRVASDRKMVFPKSKVLDGRTWKLQAFRLVFSDCFFFDATKSQWHQLHDP